ncbi:HAMP domain-containing sensor histidine kinase [Nitrosomonas sp. Is35]|uniref:sensor histidine kinase n=1 Tax=Nitrosomonas sp. Is35 TaxID=3080534 RepID=UPI00294B5F87|nr:HAMP domain-containing sensor histidine kinase [Nitrosomonas sp. Is35]MDV6347542.1 HAMP domain-containing sensor histidine kinase [Nitrosomonas sp. Is35]
MATTEFSWDKSNSQNILLEIKGDKLKLSDDVLISNIRWFITFRWALIVTLVFFEILMLSASNVLTQFGISEQQKWPVAIIIVLVVANIAYIFALDRFKPGKYNSPSINLWVQIIVDLICLSVVVHYIGSTTTPISFFYVLHIALACIFFSTRESLYVTILVCLMDTIVIIVDNFLITQTQTPLSTLVNNHLLSENARKDGAMLWMFFLDILFFIVWYVVSRLSLIVRAHERHLLDAYRQINQAQVEKDQYAVLMTHQLKSPLDAIRSKINLIKGGYCGDASDGVNEALDKIDSRAQSMSSLILDLLRLERLKDTCLNTAVFETIDIQTTLQKCIEKLTLVANAKHIAFNLSIENFYCKVIPDQLEILLENIITNAITYSHDNTAVEITSAINQRDRSASITITDHGIGIENKDLPNIFNEYFYSPRAALHNKATSGIGLSIVRIAAENNKLKIKVTSEPGAGTSFTVLFNDIELPDDDH